MMCYRDMSFCSSDCVNTECIRNITPEVTRDAAEWWKGFNQPDERVPFSLMDFSKDCPDYQPEKAGWDYPATQRTQPKELTDAKE